MRSSFLVAVLPLVLAACAQGVAPSQAGDLTLENRTGGAVMYNALELEASHLVDPAPEWRVRDRPERLVSPGGRQEVQIEGYKRGDDVRLFIYHVDAASEKAVLTWVLTLTDTELRRTNFRVVVDTL